jgi:hypothetical protein
MDVWALQAMAIVEADGTAWNAHEACMAKLRSAGVIR